MARNTTEKTRNEYRDFEYTGKEFKYSGRIWPELKDVRAKSDRTPMNLTLNGVITIKGCRLVQTDESCFIAFPQFKKKDGTYDSYVFTPKEYDELDKVAAAAEAALK